jgi:hypothetical protein
MAYCPVIPIINNGRGWGNNYVPRELLPCYAYYRRTENGMRYAFKEYIEKLKDVKPTIHKEGNDFTIYAIEQDDIREWVEYNKVTKMFKLTSEIF